MGEYSSKKSLFFQNCFFKNSYLADRQNGKFSKKFAKPIEGGVKFLKNKGKRLYLQEIYSFGQMTDKTCQYIVTSSNYGYLNSIIIIIMVTAAINANEQRDIQ